jgi:dipeptidyl aminopeptidase/acylaminoacyl peptidase
VAAGKRFDLVLYPQSSHGWSRPEVWLHSTRAAFEFFETHLKKQ